MTSGWFRSYSKRPSRIDIDSAEEQNGQSVSSTRLMRSLRGGVQIPFVGDTVKFAQDPFKFVSESISRFGPVFSSNIALKRTAIAASYSTALDVFNIPFSLAGAAAAYSEWMGNVYKAGSNLLVTDNPYKRSHLKSQLRDAISPNSLQLYWPLVEAVTDRYFDKLSERLLSSSVVDIYTWAKGMFEDVMSVLALGESTGSDNAAADKMRAWRRDHFNMIVSIPYEVNLPMLKLQNGFSRGTEATQCLLRLIRERIFQSRTCQSRNRPATVLDYLAQSEKFSGLDDVSDEDYDNIIAQHILLLSNNVISKSLATSLAYLLFELANSPDWLRKCQENPCNLEACLYESLRLHPPMMGGIRYLSVEKSGNGVNIQNVQVPSNSRLWYSCIHANTDPAVYHEAIRFDPQRWQAPQCDQTSTADNAFKCPFLYPPATLSASSGSTPAPTTFGGGDHSCPGRDLSWSLLISTSRRIIELYDVRPGPHSASLQISERYFPVLRPSSGTSLTLDQRF